MTSPAQTIRIFVSSPGDVAAERELAREVIASLQGPYAGRAKLVPLLWEDLPLGAGTSFQAGIDSRLGARPPGADDPLAFGAGVDVVLSEPNGVDIAVFILWSRLGSPLNNSILRPDGGTYRSGTEREFDLMMAAREKSGGSRPHVMVYIRRDDSAFKSSLTALPKDKLPEAVEQERLLNTFIEEKFRDAGGRNTSAYHSYGKPPDFADRLRLHLREQINSMLTPNGDAVAVWDTREKGSPFRGLLAFDQQHSTVFCGRGNEVCELLTAFRRRSTDGCSFVLILGASGSGKSSLARAGLAPAVSTSTGDNGEAATTTWRQALFFPGEATGDLLAGLSTCLTTALPELVHSRDFTEVLRKYPADVFGLRLREIMQKPGPGGTKREIRLLLIVDQLEELFTHSAVTSAAREEFFSAMWSLAAGGCVWIAATLRSDCYAFCHESPGLMKLRDGEGGQFDLLPPSPAALHSIITAPAHLAGLSWEENAATGIALDQEILNEATAHPGTLPLLEYLLDELYKASAGSQLLTFANYRALGGITGALGRRADEELAKLPPSVRDLLPSVLRALVTLAGDDVVSRIRVPHSAFGANMAAGQLVDAFVCARLFQSDRHPVTGEPVISVAHEALLRVWPAAVGWVASDREFLRSRARLRDSLKAWQEAVIGRDDFLLPPGKPLEDARALLDRFRQDLSPAEVEYIDLSTARHEAQAQAELRTLRRRNRIAFALTAAAVVAAIVAVTQRSAMVTERNRANTNQAVAEKARHSAEGLINDMLFDLKDRLEPIGRLELLAGVSDSANRYFEQLKDAPGGSPELQRALALASSGDIAVFRGDSIKARAALAESLTILNRLAVAGGGNDRSKVFSGLASVASLQAKAHGRLGSRIEQESVLREALATIGKEPAANVPPSASAALNESLGDYFYESKNYTEAESHYRRFLDWQTRAVETEAGNLRLQQPRVWAMTKLARALAAQKQPGPAGESWAAAQALAAKLYAEHPENREFLHDQAVVIGDRAEALATAGDFAAARTGYGDYLARMEELGRHDATNTKWQWDLSNACVELADAEAKDKSSAAAPGLLPSDLLLRAITIREQLVRIDSKNLKWHDSLYKARKRLLNVLIADKESSNDSARSAAILTQSRLALETCTLLTSLQPEDADFQIARVQMALTTGALLARAGEAKEAITILDTALSDADKLPPEVRATLDKYRDKARQLRDKLEENSQ